MLPPPCVGGGRDFGVCVSVHAHAEAAGGHLVSCSITLGLIPLRQGMLLSLQLGYGDHLVSAHWGYSHMFPEGFELMLGQQVLSVYSVPLLFCFLGRWWVVEGAGSLSLSKASLD